MADLIHLSSPSSSKLFSLTSCLSNSLASQRSGRGRAASVSLPASAFSRSSSGSRLRLSKVHATSNIAETKQPKWWEKSGGPNMMDIHSTQEFFSTLNQAGDRLVIVKFYATWCASCKALLPKLCRTAEEHPEILFLKVNFDENKPMCKSLNVRVLPYFHLYRGAHGQLESFSCSLAKFKKLRDAIALHNASGFTIGPPKKTGELTLESLSAPISNSPAESN